MMQQNKTQTTQDFLMEKLKERRPGHSLPQALYTDSNAFEADLDAFFRHEWLFVCHSSEISRPGDFQRFDVANNSVIILRGRDGEIRALHNVCRHRGSRLCEKSDGRMANIVCPYHQWVYDLTGALKKANGMGDDFDLADRGLHPAHVNVLEGCVFVCMADTASDFDSFAIAVRPYLKAQGLADAKVAHVSTIIEQGNWKLTWENYNECYHCDNGHPELGRTFPINPVDHGAASGADAEEFRKIWESADRQGMPRETVASDDGVAFRFYRRPLLAESMTMDGKPAVQMNMGHAKDASIGDVGMVHKPNLFGHLMADHALFMRIVPLAPDRTQLQTRWLVHKDAVEGEDYDLKTLTEVWLATNDQDARFVRLSQQGIGSSGYEPGPYSPTRETSPLAFTNWYCDTLAGYLEGGATG